MSLLCYLSTGLELKATFLFPPNSVSVFFIRLQWTEKAKIWESKNLKNDMLSRKQTTVLKGPAEDAEVLKKFWYQ